MTRNTVAGGIIFHSVKDGILLDMSFFTTKYNSCTTLNWFRLSRWYVEVHIICNGLISMIQIHCLGSYILSNPSALVMSS